MLDELAVHNLGMLAEARIEPGPGLVVITGETGAGKTMLLGALELLLGFSARADLVGPEDDEAFVEGRFLDAAGDEVVVSRRLRKAGRSRAYLDGEMAPLRSIADKVGGLVEIVAQHDHLTIGREPELRTLLDRVFDDDGRAAAQAYDSAWADLQACESLRADLGGDLRAVERERELAAWQAQEIAAAGFELGDDEELLRTAGRLRNADALIEELSAAHRSLRDGSDALGTAVASLRKAAQLDPGHDGLCQAVEATFEDHQALLSDVRSAREGVVHDPAALEQTEARLALLGDLRRKYGQSMDEILAFGEQAARRADELAEALAKGGRIEADLAAARARVVEAGRLLSRGRRRAGNLLAERTVQHLVELGFNDPIVDVDLTEADPRASGTDKLTLLFSSDRRLEPAPVNRVASGGELSRLVLALRLAGGAGDAPIIAFDEIDAGVGGRTALALGKKLSELSRQRQVLAVTHLPQVAAFADSHFTVDRTDTTATVRCLDEAGQIDELSRMLAGLEDSDGGRQHAAELRQAALASRS